MRLTIEQAASGYRVDASLLQGIVDQGLVALDANGTVNHLLAQAMSRYVSDEFEALFGASATLPGLDLVFTGMTNVPCARFVQAGTGLLGIERFGIVPGGRQFYQVSDFGALYSAGVTELSDQVSSHGFLIREEDTSEMQAFADAYMLGDTRVQTAIRTHLASASNTAA
ncbi:hypothetical protein [Corynebacterium haemomassiliense]|uniref:hypothetical protein n=1 Tax=Corynebacterium haemomassiliense TaxID=2754726 RepID=UPI00288C6187|nr:hypothetical protein [Corynebacterium haemomassiliense]